MEPCTGSGTQDVERWCPVINATYDTHNLLQIPLYPIHVQFWSFKNCTSGGMKQQPCLHATGHFRSMRPDSRRSGVTILVRYENLGHFAFVHLYLCLSLYLQLYMYLYLLCTVVLSGGARGTSHDSLPCFIPRPPHHPASLPSANRCAESAPPAYFFSSTHILQLMRCTNISFCFGIRFVVSQIVTLEFHCEDLFPRDAGCL